MQEGTGIIRQIPSVGSSRAVQENIPAGKAERNMLLGRIREYVSIGKLAGPLSLEELRSHTRQIIRYAKVEEKYHDYIAVLLNNEVGRELLAGIPYHKRLLLLPKCLRHKEKCRAKMDEYGLICGQCGSCVIDDLKSEAEQLGYVVLVAEGSPLVMMLIESGQVEAVVGVSCLSVLEQVFPYMAAAGVAGMAIPLLQEGCENTSMDVDWVWDAIHLSSEEVRETISIEELRAEVDSWFTRGALDKALGPAESETEGISREWLAKSGKRWRPFLAACVWQVLQEGPDRKIPPDLQKLAWAVESFHKASLIHDDIEDKDALRYGEKTLHEQYGVEIALNVGDFLVGEGYRLIGELQIPAERKARMLAVAAAGHRTLCLGQGAELWWRRKGGKLTTAEVLDIFQQKTAPAFEVALRLGAILGGADEKVERALHHYSEALGIAYQIRDDLADTFGGEESAPNPPKAQQPSLPPAIAYEQARGQDWQTLKNFRSAGGEKPPTPADGDDILQKPEIERLTQQLLESFKNQAIRSLAGLDHAHLKSLLRRVVGRIFHEVEVMGCCDDYQARNAGRRRKSKKAAR